MSFWKAATSAAALLTLLVLLIIIGPVLTIWSLNTLFGTGIEFTVTSWLAVLWITVALSAAVGVRR